MSCGIYKITNKINGKCYIGQSVNIERRWNEHASVAFNEKQWSYNSKLSRALRKYGRDNFVFEIIEECSCHNNNKREIFWIDHYKAVEEGYNICLGGETTVKISREAVKSLWEDGKGCAEISKTLKTNHSTVSNILKELSIYNAEEVERRRHNTLKRAVNSYDLKGNFIESFESLRAAARAMGTPDASSSIGAVCRGKRKTLWGRKWEYAE